MCTPNYGIILLNILASDDNLCYADVYPKNYVYKKQIFSHLVICSTVSSFLLTLYKLILPEMLLYVFHYLNSSIHKLTQILSWIMNKKRKDTPLDVNV